MRLNDKVSILYIDIDEAQIDEGFLRSLAESGITEEIKIYITRNGYHVKLYFFEGKTKLECVYLMARLSADQMAIYQFLAQDGQTLFNVRRGVQNQWHIASHYGINQGGKQ